MRRASKTWLVIGACLLIALTGEMVTVLVWDLSLPSVNFVMLPTFRVTCQVPV